jgi:hypothetical protein
MMSIEESIEPSSITINSSTISRLAKTEGNVLGSQEAALRTGRIAVIGINEIIPSSSTVMK